MPEPELVRELGRCAEDHRDVAVGLQCGTTAQQPGVSRKPGEILTFPSLGDGGPHSAASGPDLTANS